MLEKIISKIESTPVTILGFLAGFLGIVLIRNFLEAFSNPSRSGVIASDATTLIHYFIFYMTTYLLLAIILGFFSGNYEKSSKVLLFGFIILWLPPILDFIFSGNAVMAYVFDVPVFLIKDFFTFFGSIINGGVTFGIKVEVAIILTFSFWYIYRTQKKLIRAILGTVAIYTALFFLLSLPSFFYLFKSSSSSILILNTDPRAVISFIESSISNSTIIQNALHSTFSYKSPERIFEVGFNKIISQVLIPILTGLLALWFYLSKRAFFLAVIKNSRPVRAGFYILMISLGAFFAVPNGNFSPYGWIDIFGFLSLSIAWYASWMFAVTTNDIEDRKIDAISNKERPIVKGDLSKENMKSASIIFLALSLLAGFSAGFYQFFMILIFTATYFVYSVSPLRLKRIPILSSLLISFAVLASVLAGFFFTSPDKILFTFPLLIATGIVICYSLFVNFRDLKDIKGDMAEEIKTIPVIFTEKFGENRGFQAVGILVALAFIISPIFLLTPKLFFFSLPAGILGYFLCIAKPYKEKNIFILYSLYTIITVLFFV